MSDSNLHASASLFIASDGTMIALQHVARVDPVDYVNYTDRRSGDARHDGPAVNVWVPAEAQHACVTFGGEDAKRFVQALLDYHDIRMGVPCER